MAEERQRLNYDCTTVNNLLDTVNNNKDVFPFDVELNESSPRGLPNSVIAKEINALKGATSNNKGYFLTEEKLLSAYPIASEGFKAYVGSNYPYAIYLYQGGRWVNTGETGGDDAFVASEFYTKIQIDQQHEVINNQIARVEKGANYEVLEYETSIATTRLKVKEKNRKGGYMITYNAGTGWIKEQYIGELTDNEEWIKDENWKAEVLNENIQAIAENAQQQANLAATNAALAEEKATEAATQAAYAKEQGDSIKNGKYPTKSEIPKTLKEYAATSSTCSGVFCNDLRDTNTVMLSNENFKTVMDILKRSISIVGSTDLDTLEWGIYDISNGSGINKPTAKPCILASFNFIQFYIDKQNPSLLFVRVKNGSQWDGWKEITLQSY